MIKGIIFDLDGVIVSTDEYHYLAWKEVFTTFNIHLTREDNNLLRGVSRMECVNIICNLYGLTLNKEEKERVASFKNELYLKLLSLLSKKDLKDEVKRTLQDIKELKLKMAIGSSSKNAIPILKRIGMVKQFDVIVDGNKITLTKPNPEVFLRAAALIGLEPSECLVVEDSQAGIDGAKAGGFLSIGIGDAINSNRADYFATTFHDIYNIITTLNNDCSPSGLICFNKRT